MRILVIEDEQKLARALQESLVALHFDVDLAASGEDGFYLASTETFDIVILDLNLPGRDGIEVLRTLRQRGWKTPVLVLTARDGLEDRVQGLDSGADDYLVKPFAFPELHARIRALTRRGRTEEEAKLRCADIEMDRLARTVTRAGRAIELTAKEFEMLEFLLRHQGHVVSREMLAKELWGERARAVPLDNVIDVHIARLRAKVDSPFASALIRTVRGVGFSMQEQD
ncbi:MAG: response regulator transcription factor [Gammaproteobacteria bacterium]|nr:response regulator transcription factor [Gammaproteobacteria bacterium]